MGPKDSVSPLSAPISPQTSCVCTISAATDSLTGDAEAEDALVIPHQLLQQSALPRARGATQNDWPWSFHHWGEAKENRGLD